jgi:hypothetical protein
VCRGEHECEGQRCRWGPLMLRPAFRVPGDGADWQVLLLLRHTGAAVAEVVRSQLGVASGHGPAFDRAALLAAELDDACGSAYRWRRLPWCPSSLECVYPVHGCRARTKRVLFCMPNSARTVYPLLLSVVLIVARMSCAPFSRSSSCG